MITIGSFRLYYGWIVVSVAFVTILVSAGVRSGLTVVVVPLEQEFGWDRASISLAAAINLLLIGLIAPFVGRLIDRHGPRAVMLGSTAITAAGVLATMFIQTVWQLHLSWGLVVGVGIGGTAGVLSATVASRWFDKRRGLVVGILSAATSAGQFILLPLLVVIIVAGDWRNAMLFLGALMFALLLPLVFLFMRDDPVAMGIGVDGAALAPKQPGGSQAGPVAEPIVPMSHAVRTADFWFLTTSFFICGATTNGLIGTHLIPHSIDHGIPEVTAASIIGFMGMMNFVGTTASGWLSDRYDKRKLLAGYYAFRGISLLFLPFISEVPLYFVFALVYGLDWVATVPPTVGLVADRFGRRSVGGIYGFVYLSHQLGAGMIAYVGGALRVLMGNYALAFIGAGVLALVAAGLASRISVGSRVPPAQPLQAQQGGAAS